MRFYLMFLILFFHGWTVWACTSMVVRQPEVALLASNLDWSNRDVGQLILHPRYEFRQVEALPAGFSPMSWTSRYGSMVIHEQPSAQVKTHASIAGMNERGLAGAVLLVKDGEFGKQVDKPTLRGSLWLQYVLDNYASVDEVLEQLPEYQVIPDEWLHQPMKIHLLVADSLGGQAVIEYQHGEPVIYTQDTMPVPVLSNHAYANNLERLKDYHSFGGQLPIPGEFDALSRFVRAAVALKSLPKPLKEDEKIGYTFQALSYSEQGLGARSTTYINLVMDLHSKTLYFRTMHDAELRYVRVHDVRFDELSQEMHFNVYEHQHGNLLDAMG